MSNLNSGDSQHRTPRVVITFHWSGEITLKCYFCKETISVLRHQDQSGLTVTFTDSYVEEVWEKHKIEVHIDEESIHSCSDCGISNTYIAMFPTPFSTGLIYCEKCILKYVGGRNS